MVSQSSVLIRFQKLNLQKVCASLVDFHFRCCQLKGIWTNQYLSVFSHIESWLLEKRGLQQTQPIPLALALGQFCPCAGVGTCPRPSPTIREASWDVIWTERAKSTSLFFLFLSFFPFNKAPNLEGALETPNMTSKGSSGSPLPAKAPRTRKSTIAGSRWQKAAAPSLTCSCDCDCSGPPLDSLYSLWFWLAPLSFTLYASCWCWPDRLPPGSQLGISVQPRGREAQRIGWASCPRA